MELMNNSESTFSILNSTYSIDTLLNKNLLCFKQHNVKPTQIPHEHFGKYFLLVPEIKPNKLKVN